eukprot:TRINITY_DN15118_c2_g1_i1.p1 TRINITY_DN15118_c2_g1~~TRINITY_DN15118_c2_g1_i1.p1  ORF type:complete len:266 (-),score=26.01 TRINITY_DN15118_c2_g1_i1:711-1508(-)
MTAGMRRAPQSYIKKKVPIDEEALTDAMAEMNASFRKAEKWKTNIKRGVRKQQTRLVGIFLSSTSQVHADAVKDALINALPGRLSKNGWLELDEQEAQEEIDLSTLSLPSHLLEKKDEESLLEPLTPLKGSRGNNSFDDTRLPGSSDGIGARSETRTISSPRSTSRTVSSPRSAARTISSPRSTCRTISSPRSVSTSTTASPTSRSLFQSSSPASTLRVHPERNGLTSSCSSPSLSKTSRTFLSAAPSSPPSRGVRGQDAELQAG